MHAPSVPPNPQALEDANHLRMLAIGQYVLAGLTALLSCLAFIYIVIGIMTVSGQFPGSKTEVPPDARVAGWFFIVFGTIFLLLGWGMAALMALTGRWLSTRRNYTFCFVIACLECLNLPLGTVLGVFSIVVLNRPSVRALFIPGPARNNFTNP